MSILRLEALYAVTHTTDQFYNNGQVATWSVVEANIGIICPCLPTLRGLVSRYLPTLFSSTHGSLIANSGPPEIRNEVGIATQSRAKLDFGVFQLAIGPANQQSTAIDMETLHMPTSDIKVTTAVNQEIAHSPPAVPGSRMYEISDHSSTRGLVHKSGSFSSQFSNWCHDAF